MTNERVGCSFWPVHSGVEDLVAFSQQWSLPASLWSFGQLGCLPALVQRLPLPGAGGACELGFFVFLCLFFFLDYFFLSFFLAGFLFLFLSLACLSFASRLATCAFGEPLIPRTQAQNPSGVCRWFSWSCCECRALRIGMTPTRTPSNWCPFSPSFWLGGL